MNLVVSNGLVSAGAQPQLNPEIIDWHKQLSAYRQQWFNCTDKVPLAWYAALLEISPATLLAKQCSALPEQSSQFWVASPFQGTVSRDSVRVFPEGLLSWTIDDADELCDLLNPLLAEEGMTMHRVGAALLLTCRQPLQASPQGFGEISGHLLPNKHHEGKDGGRLNRLLSEIQMTLFQHPSTARHQRGEMDVNGLWLWSPTDYPLQLSAGTEKPRLAVATRNPVLQSIVDGRDAALMITEAERLHELVQQRAPLPKSIVLAGEGHAVLLTKSILPTFGKSLWIPKSVKEESNLLSTLRSRV